MSFIKNLLCVLILLFAMFSCNDAYSEHPSHDETAVDDEEAYDEDGCRFEDGDHSATVEYYNPETGHQATYDLTVDVEDCQAIQINFNNGGYLDDSHISAAELDDDGHATLEDDEGREFAVTIND